MHVKLCCLHTVCEILRKPFHYSQIACYSLLVSLPRSKTECPSVSAAFLKFRKMSQGNVFLSRDIHWHRVGDVQNSRPGLNNQSLSKAYSVPYGRVILLHARFQLFITFSKIRLKKEKMKGNFMVFTSVDCIDEFMSRLGIIMLLSHIRLRTGARF